MTPPQVLREERVHIYEGMSVETVQKTGSEGQKLMAPLFDENRDGKYDEFEARNFNNSIFHTEEGKIKIYSYDAKQPEVLELIYDDYEKDILDKSPKFYARNDRSFFVFENEKGETCHCSFLGRFGKIVLDMITGKVHVKGWSDGTGFLHIDNVEATVEDANMSNINASNSEIKLKNVKGKVGVEDSPVNVTTDSQSTINVDENSKIRIVPLGK